MNNLSPRALFLQHVAQTSPAPLALEIDRAEGCWLIDTQGKRYLDLIAGIGPSVLGHRHPAVQEAVLAQIDKYWHTLVYGEFVLAPQVEYAQLLASKLPGLDSVYFVNSGTEATEGAMKLAKRATGRTDFVACQNAYHGSTQGAASLMSPDYFTQAFRPLLPGIKHIRFNHEEDLSTIDQPKIEDAISYLVLPIAVSWRSTPMPTTCEPCPGNTHAVVIVLSLAFKII
jgi:acetylornithine/succinyldiaminopimelate/putrescine aminotransferase